MHSIFSREESLKNSLKKESEIHPLLAVEQQKKTAKGITAKKTAKGIAIAEKCYGRGKKGQESYQDWLHLEVNDGIKKAY